MSAVWERARAGRPTVVIGALPPAPADLVIHRARCGPGLAGLDELPDLLAIPSDSAVARLRTPLAHWLLRDLRTPRPTTAARGVISALRGRAAIVLTRIDRASADAVALLSDWVASGDELPLVLVSDREGGALVDLVRERFGAGAVLALGAPQAPLAGLPSDVLHVVLAGAALGSPFTLDAVVDTTGRRPGEVLAALQSAALRGVRLTDDGAGTFSLDEDLETEARAALIPTLAAQLRASSGPRGPGLEAAPLLAARRAVAIGAWAVARRRFLACGPEAAVEHAALCWAMGDPAEARALLESDESAAAREARLGLSWSQRAELSSSLVLAEALPEPRRTLDRAALMLRHGAGAGVQEALRGALFELSGEDRAAALHLLARLPLVAAPPNAREELVEARRAVRDALADDPDDAERGRLLETAARLALRATEAEAAAARYREAIPLLEATGQPIAHARAVAGLATCAGDAPGAVPVAEALAALDRAVRANRTGPTGLAWCRMALQALMERVEITSRSGLLSDLRRISLEIAALQAQYRQPRNLGPL